MGVAKIVRLEAENIKGIKAVDITAPAVNVIRITGANEQGKTSVLDAITMAVGGAGCIPPNPIRHGAKDAHIILDCGEFIVERKWTNPEDLSKTYLTVKARDGKQYSSPQALLNSWIGSLSFDPLEFAGMEAKQQMEELAKLIKLDIDLDEWEIQQKGIYDERTIVNRRLRELQGQLKGLTRPKDDLPAEPVSLTALTDQLNGALEAIRSNEDKRRQLEKLRGERERAVERIQAKKQEIERLQAELAKLETAKDDIDNRGIALKKEVEKLINPDTVALREAIKNAESTNQQIRESRLYQEKVKMLKAEESASADLSYQLEANGRRKREAIQQAEYPIEGLSLSDEHVTYRGIPFEQLSGAETLKVSMAVAMAVNPKMRVIRIKDGSLLDSKNLAIIDRMAGDNNFQIWMESVDETGEIGIVIEAGEVKTNNYEASGGKAINEVESESVLE